MVIDAKEFNAALENLEVAKGVSKEAILEALKEAMIKGFKKDIGDDDAIVELVLDVDKGIIEMSQVKHVVKDVEDDLLEISVEDANERGDKKYKAGEDYLIPASVGDLRKAIVLSIKAVFRQKFAEAEKEILYEQFKDKINTMITGKVESIDERGASINIGRTSVYMPRKEMIKDEKFLVGENIKLFVNDVATTSKGAHIVVSRASEGFLKALMTEEIHDIYDGTIVIRGVAREAGERSKVAVSSDDINVDPAGSCIGPNGSRIQKVVSQLGNGSQKEKIDIIGYSDNAALYIMEALKPARIAGIKLDEEKKSALVVVKDDSLSLAIGRKGVNARLAVKLTGYAIDIKTETEAQEQGLEYKTFEEISAIELELRAQKIAEKQRESLVYQNTDTVLPGLPEGYVAPQARKYEDEVGDLDEALEREIENEEEIVAPVKTEAPVVEQPKVEVKEEVKPQAPVQEKKEEPVVTATVKTTTTLEDLEKSLESSKQTQKSSYSKHKKKDEEEKDEEKVVKNDGPRMSIYTEEELKEMEEEEKNIKDVEEDEDIDYDEYDDYYDEK